MFDCIDSFILWWVLKLLLLLCNCNNAAWNTDTKVSPGDPDFHSSDLKSMVILPLSFLRNCHIVSRVAFWYKASWGGGSVVKALAMKQGDLSSYSSPHSKGHAWLCLPVIPTLEGRGRDRKMPGTHWPASPAIWWTPRSGKVLPPKLRWWLIEEGAQCRPLASKCTRTCVRGHTHTHKRFKSVH